MLSRSRKAFTLLELIVVIVILGILAALAIPTFAAVIKKARVSTAISAAESVGRDAIALAAFDDSLVRASDINTIVTGADAEVDGVVVKTELAGSKTTLTINEIDVELTFTGNSVKGAEVVPVLP